VITWRPLQGRGPEPFSNFPVFFNRWLQQTLYKQVDGLPATHTTDCIVSSPRYLALWLGLQHIGHDGMVARIQHSVNLVTTDHGLLLTIFVAQIEQLVSYVSACTDSNYLTKWSLTLARQFLSVVQS